MVSTIDVLRTIAGLPHTPQQVVVYISSDVHLLSYLASGLFHPLAIPLSPHLTLVCAFSTRALFPQRRALGRKEDSRKHFPNIRCHGHPDLARVDISEMFVIGWIDYVEVIESVLGVDHGK